jgi:hypothetical protein
MLPVRNKNSISALEKDNIQPLGLDLDKGTSQINVIKVQIVLESINI